MPDSNYALCTVFTNDFPQGYVINKLIVLYVHDITVLESP